jgi:hypothetical protein
MVKIQASSDLKTHPPADVSEGEAEVNDDNKSTCSSSGGQMGETPEVIKCWGDNRAAEWEKENDRSGLDEAVPDLTTTVAQPSDKAGESPEGEGVGEQVDDTRSTCSSCDDKPGSKNVIKCYWEPKVPEDEDFGENSEASTSTAPTLSSNTSGSLRFQRRPALRGRTWWAGFQNPKQAFQIFVQAKETMQRFEHTISKANSPQAKEYLGHMVDTVPQSFAPRARKALENTYLSEFGWLRKEDAERMAQESIEWAWLEKAKAMPVLVEDDVIRCFELEGLVEGDTWACECCEWR